MLTNTERLRLVQAQLAECEQCRESADLRANHAVSLLTRDRARLAYAVNALRAIHANTWSPERMTAIVLDALQQIGEP